ncbi:MAG: aminotransferase class I/II-fold pyridoxal phosphate-dependent enzyme, partial [Chloroflexi bacterium]|nr:aminotransferase class I/II-fold pyridoxal phosphate-dependent enzyme [Chloroflexota bacterium]
MSARFDFDTALRPALRGMDGYEPIEPPEEAAARYGVAPGDVVKLDGNENPYGPSPRARKALAGGYEAHRYPDPDQRRLRAALAARHHIPESSIVAGAGADELIDLVFRVFVDPGDRVVIASPTFGMYGFGARLYGANLVDAPRDEADWSIDSDALVEAAEGAKAVFVPSPNNPTG